MGSQVDITRLLIKWSRGQQNALDELMPLVYNELHRLAAAYMRRERAEHTLQPTALVHEAYLKLVDQKRARWQNRAQFLGVAAQLMRRILVDHARSRQNAKHGGAVPALSLDEAQLPTSESSPEILELDTALSELASFDARKSQVVELRVFGGMTIEETSRALGVATSTVINDYRAAKAWLYREIGKKRAGL